MNGLDLNFNVNWIVEWDVDGWICLHWKAEWGLNWNWIKIEFGWIGAWGLNQSVEFGWIWVELGAQLESRS